MKTTVLPLLVLAALLAAACYAPAVPVPPPDTPAAIEAAPVDAAATPDVAVAPMETSAIPVEALKNATYGGIYDQPITLTDGLHEVQPPAQDDPSRPIVEYIDGAELTADLDNDGVDDAVVFLLERGGGSGAFTYVAAQLNRDGQPVDAGAVRIEDRIGVKSAAVKDGQVALDIITQGPGDVACCGMHNAHKTYAVQDGRLVETTPAGGDLVKVSAADLDGTSWTLLEIDGEELAPAEAEVTLSFQDGQVSGSGDCNDYTASFSLDEVNPFAMVIGPLTATEQACPDPAGAQEALYFAALEGVNQWGYVFGQLAFYYQDDSGEQGRLLFAPQAAPAGEAAMPETDSYTAASSLTRNGFAKDGEQMRGLDGQVVKLWGFVDHGNLYGDEGAKAILGDWWSGEGPEASTWRFNLKGNAGDAVGESFAVHVPNDAGRDDLLRAFVADARAGRPTKVFVTGRLATFEAPSSDRVRTGLTMEVQSSSDILLEAPSELR